MKKIVRSLKNTASGTKNVVSGVFLNAQKENTIILTPTKDGRSKLIRTKVDENGQFYWYF